MCERFNVVCESFSFRSCSSTCVSFRVTSFGRASGAVRHHRQPSRVRQTPRPASVSADTPGKPRAHPPSKPKNSFLRHLELSRGQGPLPLQGGQGLELPHKDLVARLRRLLAGPRDRGAGRRNTGGSAGKADLPTSHPGTNEPSLTRSPLGRSIGEQAARVVPIYLPPTREHMARYSHDLAWAAQSESRPECSPPGNKPAIILLAGPPPEAPTGGALPELSSVEESTGGEGGQRAPRRKRINNTRAEVSIL